VRGRAGLRAGLAQIFLSDVDDTISEVKRAREDGLVGVLLPADHFTSLQNVYYPKYEELWSVLEDLDMSIGRHGVAPAEPSSPETGSSGAIGQIEAIFFARRVLTALLVGGIFERHKRLRFIITETTATWVPEYLRALDAFMEAATVPGSLTNMLSGSAADVLKRKPSEYFAEQCWVGSFLTDEDIKLRHEIGVDRIMWGADFPHHEGTSPHTRLAFRKNFAGLPEDEVRMMLGGTAARVYGLDLDKLQPLADDYGPSIDDVDAPVTPDEIPPFPWGTVCPTFDSHHTALRQAIS
jgi:predicted TIM-barrel fold metal-dependent hydrolase